MPRRKKAGRAIPRASLAPARLAPDFFLDALADTVPDFIYFKDTEGRFLRVNRALAALYGLADPAQAVGKSDFDFYPREEAERFRRDEQEILRTGTPVVAQEERGTYPDGRVVWNLTTKMPLRDRSGRIVGTFGVSRDITPLKRAEEALAERAYLLNTLMENVPDNIFFKDREGRFILVSRQHALRCGFEEPSKVVGKTDFDIFPAAEAEGFRLDDQKVMESGAPLVGNEERKTYPDGRVLWTTTTKVPLRDREGKLIGTFGLSRDITRRKQAEEDLRRHVEAMERDLRRAQIVQGALLPSRAPAHDRLLVDFRYVPLESVGGDYLSFLPLPGGGLGVFLGDVTGHGVTAALFMALIKFLSDRLAERMGNDPPGLVRALNSELVHRLPSTFVSVLYACLEPGEGGVRLVMAGGGHPSPILVPRGEGAARYLPVHSTGALGILGAFDATPTEAGLAPGDRLYLFTDGVSEARDRAGMPLGKEAFLELVGRCGRPTLGETLDAILRGVRERNPEGPASDDMILCGIEVRERRPAAGE